MKKMRQQGKNVKHKECKTNKKAGCILGDADTFSGGGNPHMTIFFVNNTIFYASRSFFILNALMLLADEQK